MIYCDSADGVVLAAEPWSYILVYIGIVRVEQAELIADLLMVLMDRQVVLQVQLHAQINTRSPVSNSGNPFAAWPNVCSSKQQAGSGSGRH